MNHINKLSRRLVVVVLLVVGAGVAMGHPTGRLYAYRAPNAPADTIVSGNSANGLVNAFANARQLDSVAFCSGKVEGGDSYSNNLSDSDGITYELHADECTCCTYSWAARGGQHWSGSASAAAGWRCSASLKLCTLLAFQGDLSIRNSCLINVSADSSDSVAVNYEAPLKFGVTYSRSRPNRETTSEDTERGTQGDSNSGPGPKVRVDTTTAAETTANLDSSVLSWATGTAIGESLIKGGIQLVILVNNAPGSGMSPATGGPDSGGGGGGGPTTPPDVLIAQITPRRSGVSNNVEIETGAPTVPKPSGN
jgi:hypothetical protein